MYVHGFVARKQDVVYSGLATATELGRLVQKHKDDVRVLVLNSKADVVASHSMTTTLSLPKDGSPLGVVFTGTRISGIRANSPLEHIAVEGMYVHALSAPGIQYIGIASAEELKERLQKHKGEVPRKMVLSHRPNPTETTIKMVLPTGPLHLHFKDAKNQTTPVLEKIQPNSPLVDTLMPGLKVVSLEAPQHGAEQAIRMEHKFKAWDLERALMRSEETDGRILTLVQDVPQGKPEDDEISTIYPTPEDVAMTVHRRDPNEEPLGRYTGECQYRRQVASKLLYFTLTEIHVQKLLPILKIALALQLIFACGQVSAVLLPWRTNTILTTLTTNHS
jgi:hypothetical protein